MGLSKDQQSIIAEAKKSVERDEQFKKKHFRLYRFGEIIPGVMVYLVLAVMITLAFVAPYLTAVIMLVYVLSWLIRAFRFTYFLLRAYGPFKRSLTTPWHKILTTNKDLAPMAKKVRHVILAATYKEEYETLARALRSLANTTFPKDQIIFVLATEERDHDNAQKIALQLKQEFGSLFGDFIITEHPADIAGEVKGKGSNISWAGRVARDYAIKKGFDLDLTLVTSIDADHRLHNEYLSALTYEFLEDENRQKTSYVSVALFFNNIWDVPSPVRFIHFSSSFWMMTTSVWTSRLHNVMTQTQTMSALMKTDFYSPTSIVEDGHQYWRSLFVFGTNYSVKMILMPVYSDAVLTDTWLGTLKEQYLQRRRWHYGISDLSFVMTHFLTEKKNRTLRIFVDMLRHWDGHFSLATSSVMLGVVGWVPILTGGLSTSVLGLNFQSLYVSSLRYALVGVLLSAIISFTLIPPKKEGKPLSRLYILWDYILLPIQIPLSIILASSLPSIDAHTRLMLGKYLGFRVTKKAVSQHTVLST